MGQARVGNDGIKQRQLKIEAWKEQISVWELMKEKSPALDKIKEAAEAGIKRTKEDIVQRVKTLSFASEADRLDLAKMAGNLDALESFYYDIADAPKKIEGAEKIIAKLSDEIKKARRGELEETRA